MSPFDRIEAARQAAAETAHIQDRDDAITQAIARMQTGTWSMNAVMRGLFDAGFLTGHMAGTSPLEVEGDRFEMDFRNWSDEQNQGGVAA